ncbi:hypothetical protein OKW45_002763 [Paraburkholderia sp. WSM4175]|uniref:hypothetical protein n=1 Tax=Paraburkholderia sp. WSM4175 TaxID=2991072 RepID=UPI003D207E3F
MKSNKRRVTVNFGRIVSAVLCSTLSSLPAAAAGPTVAYAHVSGNGTLDMANSKNVLQMATDASGFFCFKLSFAPKTVMATISQDPTAPIQGNGFIRAAIAPTPLSTCTNLPNPSSVVGTFNQTGSTGGYAFYVYWTK